MAEEKTEKPTVRKNKENRKEGRVPRTQELGGWGSMLLVAMLLPWLMGKELDSLQTLMKGTLRATADADMATAFELLAQGLWHIATVLVLLGASVMVVGVGAALAQGGFYLATKSMKPKWSKLDPIQGAKRVFGTQALWEGAKMLIKSSVVCSLAYGVVVSMMALLGGFMPIPVVLSMVKDEALGMIRNIAMAAMLFGALDYIFQRRKVSKQANMTKDEVKREHKNSEGDPLLKSAIRSRQLAASRNRMIAEVPTADVVLVNPTHVAVALKYDAENGAPRVVARGAGAIASRIRSVAVEHRVPLVQDVPLARALHSSTQVGQEIPAELFAAVAQVLAFVITRRSRGQHGGEHRSPRSESELPKLAPRGRRRRSPSGPATPTPAAPLHDAPLADTPLHDMSLLDDGTLPDA